MEIAEFLRPLLLFLPVFVLSVTFHEFAHGVAADKLGDSTARYMGRLTLDPMAHISWFGTIIFPTISLLTGAPLFGWANPVPVDMRNFHKAPRLRMALVAAAGPASNILLAIIFTALLSFTINHFDIQSLRSWKGLPGLQGAAIELFFMAISLNLMLAFFNLLPLPPLDGFRIVQGFVPEQDAQKLDQFESMGQWILLGLLIFGVLRFLAKPIEMFMIFLFQLFGIGI